MNKTSTSRVIYVCPECHLVARRPLRHHKRLMVKCDAGVPGDERSKPIFDEHGHLLTRAPRWWVEACLAKHARKRQAA